MIQRPQSQDAIKQFDRLDLVEDALMTFGIDRLPETKDADTVKNAIDAAIGKRVHALQVLIEDDCVIVKATAPSFYVRQLVEHKSRAVVEDLKKTFVSRVVVKN